MKLRSIILTAVIAATLFPTMLAANTATVEKIMQGDRLQIKGWEIVRLTGIIVPKRNESGGEEAYQLAKQELEGRLVVMSTYTTDNTAAGIVRDTDGLCLVNITYGGGVTGQWERGKGDAQPVEFNELLLEKGLARVDDKYLPTWMEHYRDIEKQARESKIGIWGR